MLRLPPELQPDSQAPERDPPDGFDPSAPSERIASAASAAVEDSPSDSPSDSPPMTPKAEPQADSFAKSIGDKDPFSQVKALPPLEPAASTAVSSKPTADAPTDGPPSPLAPQHSEGNHRWYLGIDVGSTGLSAVLLNQKQQCLYPISWAYLTRPPSERSASPSTLPPTQPSTPWFRLPTTILLYFAGQNRPSILSPKWGLFEKMEEMEGVQTDGDGVQQIQLRSSKDYLNITIPHYAPQSGRWEPEILHGGQSLTLNQSYSLPLSGFYQALQILLSTLSPSLSSTFTPPHFVIKGRGGASPSHDPPSIMIESRVWGLAKEHAQAALKTLKGVVVGYPIGWTAAYRFNVREAVLGARLVSRADQVVMVGDGLATLLSRLPSADGTPINLPEIFQQASLNADHYQGSTLVMNGGTVTTELAIAHVSQPTAPKATLASLRVPVLKPNNVLERSLAYGGDALDQDIISQILYPRLTELGPAIAAVLGHLDLIFPSTGEPDGENRLLLQHQLHQAPLGRELIQQARHLKLTLQTQKTSVFAIAHHQWTIHQQELGNRVLLPYVQRLHREVNALLDRGGMVTQEIRHIICSGGTTSLRFITLWLQKTFPHATITQDVHQGDLSPTMAYNIVPTCSRVAYGLASLPMHPHLMDWVTHQPCDYDLLMEMGRTLPAQPLTLREILGFLKRRGISPSISQPCVIALLDGQIPAGLVPQGIHRHSLTEQSQRYIPYHRLLAAPLFEAMDNNRSGETIYRPNRQQWILLQQYLTALTAGTRQTLFQPLVGMDTTLYSG